MSIPIYNLRRFDYCEYHKQVCEYASVLVCKDVVQKVIRNLLKKQYINYFNEKILRIDIVFKHSKQAKKFYDFLHEFDMKYEYNNNTFYSVIIECLFFCGCQNSINIQSYNTDIKFDSKDKYDEFINSQAFIPKLVENTVQIHVPNNKVLYILLCDLSEINRGTPGLFNMLTMTSTNDLSTSFLYHLAISNLASILTSSPTLLLTSELLEKQDIEGRRMDFFVCLNNKIYLICDPGFYFIQIIHDTYNELFNKNNIDKIDEYIDKNNDAWNNYINEKIKP